MNNLADVQLEKGFTRLANETLEELAKIKLSPTQYRLLCIIWRYTYGFSRKEHPMSLSFLHQATGCDKRQIQRELKSLEKRKVIFQTIKSGSFRRISFNKNHDEWVGKMTIDGLDNGETIDRVIGETIKPILGEKDNQERKKDNLKDDYPVYESDKPNPFKEYEEHFGVFPAGTFFNHIKEWIDNSQFQEPEAIICEVIKRAKHNLPKNPPKYIHSILINLEGQGLFTLAAVQEHNANFYKKVKPRLKKKSIHNLNLSRPDHWQEPDELTSDELKQLDENVAGLI